MTCLRVTVSGKVQGVWFRKFTHEKAQELGVKGWVRNHKDGSVRIEAEAEQEILDKFCEWLWTGSPRSKVESVERWEQDFAAAYSAFEIKD